jgi:hypothetical protein
MTHVGGREGVCHGVHVHVLVAINYLHCNVSVLEVLRRFPCAWQPTRPGSRGPQLYNFLTPSPKWA